MPQVLQLTLAALLSSTMTWLQIEELTVQGERTLFAMMNVEIEGTLGYIYL